ncbi:mammalian ependymin-related protein 1-like [Saccostrea cucullata]|uniref:mammalian ependymin-related protein 1-like n=1 Tax=Saccostrea cuccullata TaxID=36930 RepID=UPI002ED2C795
MFLVVVCMLVCAVSAQAPVPCSSPPQWEGREIRVDPSQKYEEKRFLAYDETQQRERIMTEIEIGSEKKLYDILILHRENKMYAVDFLTKKCNITTINRPFRPRGVIPGSKFEGEVVIGAAAIPNESVTVLAFSGNFTGEAYTGLVSSPDCFPIQNIHFSQKYGFEQSTYYDIKVGISDPQLFLPPRECTTPPPGY